MTENDWAIAGQDLWLNFPDGKTARLALTQPNDIQPHHIDHLHDALRTALDDPLAAHRPADVLERLRTNQALSAAEQLIDRHVLQITFHRVHHPVSDQPTGAMVRERLPDRLASRGATLAALLAGRHRAHLRDEWAALLAGAPEAGHTLTSWRQLMHVLGFLVAAVRMRLHDLAGPTWVPVDWLLSAERRTNGFIAAAVGAQAVYITGHGGIPALVTEIWEPCGILGTSLYALCRWLRRVRGIELAVARSDHSTPE